MISIQINDTTLKIESGLNILQLLTYLNSPTDGIAVAVNNCIIRKNLWASETVYENDTVLIIQATQGG